MDIDDFEDRVDRWGEDVSAWPEPSRSDARALLRTSAEARQVLADAVALRTALSARASVRAPAGLTDRILAAAREADANSTSAAAPVAAAAMPPPVPSSIAKARPARRPAPVSVPGWRARLTALVAPPLRPAIVLSACFLLGIATSLWTSPRTSPDLGFGLFVSAFEDLQ